MIPMTNIGRQNSPITPWLRYLADYFKLIHIPVFLMHLNPALTEVNIAI